MIACKVAVGQLEVKEVGWRYLPSDKVNDVEKVPLRK